MIRILTDSTSDLTKEIIDEYGILVVPLHVLLGQDEYSDGVDITPEDIYKWSDKNKTTPKTSAPSFEAVSDVLGKYPDDEIICFSISDQMSTSGNVMRLSAETLEREDMIHVVDSMNLSTGIGHLVVEAAVMAKEGKSSKEILERIDELIPRVRASFVVDTLTYLHRGGRCSAVAAFAGGALKLHPKIEVTNGKMHPGRKYRGQLKHVIMSYVEDMKPDLLVAKKDRVFITHSGCDGEIVDTVFAYLESLNHFDEIIVTRAGGVISSHCGPGTLGVLYIAGESDDE